MQLERLGFTRELEPALEPHRRSGRVPARVVCEHRNRYEVVSELGALPAELSGRFWHEARARDELPVAGDWVAVEPVDERARIHALLPRRTILARRGAGTNRAAQALAANVDLVLIVTSLNGDLNVRRLDRYLALARASNVEPAIVLTKADLGLAPPDLGVLRVPVLVTSALAGTGLEEVRALLAPNRTAALLGSSGAGKSSLANALLGEARQSVAEIDENDRGRHATTRRELLLVPGGGILLDTPGLREVQPLGGGVEDVDELAPRCRFSDCRHEAEPGCAVLAAIEAGDLDAERLESWRKLCSDLRRVAWKERRRERALARREKPRRDADWDE